MNLERIELLVLDVDGVLTPGDVTFDDSNGRVMSFGIQDGWAIKRWHQTGHRTALLSGRDSPIVRRRAAELGIKILCQGISDKGGAYHQMLKELETAPEAACCVGDDLPDVGLLTDCGFAVAVANALPGVKRYADYVTQRSGGRGAVAEVIELILSKQRRRPPLVQRPERCRR